MAVFALAALPITGMGFAPVLDAVHVLGIAEVVAVLRLAQPSLLPGSFAGPFALWSRAILLALSIPVIGNKQLITVKALTATGFGLH